jgi:hypothetical protein
MDKLITVASTSHTYEAHLIKSKLESEGIPAFIKDEHVVTANWLYSLAVGGVKIQVAQRDVERAKEILDNIKK